MVSVLISNMTHALNVSVKIQWYFIDSAFLCEMSLMTHLTRKIFKMFRIWWIDFYTSDVTAFSPTNNIVPEETKIVQVHIWILNSEKKRESQIPDGNYGTGINWWYYVYKASESLHWRALNDTRTFKIRSKSIARKYDYNFGLSVSIWWNHMLFSENTHSVAH